MVAISELVSVQVQFSSRRFKVVYLFSYIYYIFKSDIRCPDSWISTASAKNFGVSSTVDFIPFMFMTAYYYC